MLLMPAAQHDKIVAGNFFACVLSQGKVYCWGSNQAGQLGIGSNENIGDEPGEMPPTAVRSFPFSSCVYSGGLICLSDMMQGFAQFRCGGYCSGQVSSLCLICSRPTRLLGCDFMDIFPRIL